MQVGQKVYCCGKPVTIESVQTNTVVVKVQFENGYGFRRVGKNEITTELDFLGNSIPDRLDSDLAV